MGIAGQGMMEALGDEGKFSLGAVLATAILMSVSAGASGFGVKASEMAIEELGHNMTVALTSDAITQGLERLLG